LHQAVFFRQNDGLLLGPYSFGRTREGVVFWESQLESLRCLKKVFDPFSRGALVSRSYAWVPRYPSLWSGQLDYTLFYSCWEFELRRGYCLRDGLSVMLEGWVGSCLTRCRWGIVYQLRELSAWHPRHDRRTVYLNRRDTKWWSAATLLEKRIAKLRIPSLRRWLQPRISKPFHNVSNCSFKYFCKMILIGISNESYLFAELEDKRPWSSSVFNYHSHRCQVTQFPGLPFLDIYLELQRSLSTHKKVFKVHFSHYSVFLWLLKEQSIVSWKA
jgi:hypothetical protein